MGIPPNHTFIDGIFPYKPSSYWVPYGQPDFSHPSADLWGPIPRHNRDGPGGSNTTPPIWEWFILPIYGDDWGIVQMALWNTHSKKLWKSHWHRILTRKKSQNSHWHGMDRVITKVITAFKETKITSEYLCSLFHQSLTQEKNDTNWYRDKQEFRSSNHPAHHGWFCHACYFRGLLGFNNVQNMPSSNHSYLQGFWIFVYIFQVLPEKGILCQNIPTNCTMLTYLKVEMIMNHSIFGISSLMGLIPFQLCDLDFSTEESSLWLSSAGNGSPSQTRVWKWNPWSILPIFFDRSNDDEPMDLGVYCPISRPRNLDRTGNSNQNSGWDERSSSSGAVNSLVKQVDWDQPLVVSHASLGSKVLSPPTNYSGLPTRSIIPWFMIICLTNWNGNSAVYPMSGQTHHQKSPRDSFALITLQLLGPELVGLLWYRLTLWLVS